MSKLRDDFQMYYTDSYIGYREGDRILPFYVESVSYDNGDEDEAYHLTDEEAYDESEYNHLYFHGIVVTNERGQTRRVTANHNDPEVELENPDSGFVKDPDTNKFRWISYRPQRSVKKGVTGRRTTFPRRFSYQHAWALFTAEDNGRISSDFAKEDGLLKYRHNVVIGIYDDNEVVLEPEASYLANVLEELLPECQIQVQ